MVMKVEGCRSVMGRNRLASLSERTIMQDRYWLYHRENGIFYLSRD